MPVEDTLPVETDSDKSLVDPDIWPGNNVLDFMLPPRDWKKHYADHKIKNKSSSDKNN